MLQLKNIKNNEQLLRLFTVKKNTVNGSYGLNVGLSLTRMCGFIWIAIFSVFIVNCMFKAFVDKTCKHSG